MISRLKMRFAFLLLLGCAVLFLTFPGICAQGFSAGIELCAGSLLPALFPFFVVSNLILESDEANFFAFPLKFICKACRLNSKKAALLLLLGWLGGYTALAASLAACRARGEISAREASLLLPIGAVCSPGFSAAVGSFMLGRSELGLVLYASCLLAGIACGIVAGFAAWPQLSMKSEYTVKQNNFSHSKKGLSYAISSAVQSSLQVCGSVIFFRMLLGFGSVLKLSLLMQAALAGLLEVSSGCRAWALLSGNMVLIGCCGCMSILSLSVWCQIKALSQGYYSLLPLALTRPLHLALSLLFMKGLLYFVPGNLPALHTMAEPVIIRNRLPGDRALLLFVFCCLVLNFLEKASLYRKVKTNYNK